MAISDETQRFRRAPWFMYPVALFVFIFAICPLLVLLVYSFYTVENFRITPGFSLKNYHEALTSGLFISLTIKALVFAVVTCVITLIFAYPTAQFIAWRSGRWKNLMLMGLLIPLYTGDLIRVYAWRIILGIKGVLNTLLLEVGLIAEPIEVLLFSNFSVMISIIYIYLPFMILPIWANIEGLDRSLIEASNDLGAGTARTFNKIMLPLTSPGVFAGVMLVFIPVTGEYLSQNLLGGTSGVTIMNVITAQFGASFNWPLGSAMAWLLLVIVAVIVSLFLFTLTRQRWIARGLGGGGA
ncbi:ABC transporter permease [Roseovarius sp. 2305UL8-3]|uniref:ABC transporter permease n=1 Tax=Roseovarius conchicola TaxID=3121636 RepID=UPI0035277638